MDFKTMPKSACKELNDIGKKITKFCEVYGYDQFELSVEEKECYYRVNAYISHHDHTVTVADGHIPKLKKVTLEDIEKRFGCPVEIIP